MAEIEGKIRKEIEAELQEKYSFDHEMAMIKIKQEWTESIERREYFLKLVQRCVDMQASDLKARIAQLEEQAEQAKPQPKPRDRERASKHELGVPKEFAHLPQRPE